MRAYFILVFVAVWICLLPLAFVDPILPAALGAFAPALAAVIVVGASEGEAGVRALLCRLLQWRVGLWWYLVVVGLPVLEALLAIGLATLLGSRTAVEIGPFIPATLIVVVFAAGEELGWRGYALPRLLVGRSALAAGLIVGVAHAVWHWPFILLPGQILNDIPLAHYTASVVAEAILFAWIFVHTRGSVLMATLFHGATNAAEFLYAGIDPAWVHWLRPAISAMIALVVVLATGPALTRKVATPGLAGG